MAKKRKLPRRAVKRVPPQLKIFRLINDARDLVEKCKFLVHRSEYLHQQGLMFNVQARELVRDAAVSGEAISVLEKRLDELEALLPRRRKKK